MLLLESDHDPRLAAMLHHGVGGYLASTMASTNFLDALAQIFEGAFPLQPGVAAQVLEEEEGRGASSHPCLVASCWLPFMRHPSALPTFCPICSASCQPSFV